MKKFPFILATSLMTAHVFAGAHYADALFLKFDPALLFSQPGVTQSITLYGDLGNTYINTSAWKNEGTVLVGAGIRSFRNEAWQLNTSISFLPVGNLHVDGEIWQLHSPLFNDLAYTYQVKSSVWLLENLLTYSKGRFQPGLLVGIGYAENTTSKFQEIPQADTAAVSLLALNGTQTHQLSYEVGAVLDYALYQKLIVELAYRYVNVGRGYLDTSTLQTTNEVLTTGILSYHVLSLGVRAYYEL